MEVGFISDFITAVGFPISCVIGLAWFIYKFTKDLFNQSKEREDKLYEIIAKSDEHLDKLEETNREFAVITGKLRDDVSEIKEVLEDMANGKV